MSKVAIIGYGNVGYHLANRIASKKHDVTIFSRSVKEDFIQPLASLSPDSFDIIILTVPNDQIKLVSDSIDTSDAIVLHTSGANPASDLSKHLKYGVIYPLQTFSRIKEVNFTSIPIFVEGSEGEEKEIFSFARSFSNDVRLLTSFNRSKLHLAAVFACNFGNHMFHLSEKILMELDMSFRDIQPLVEETLQKAILLNPSRSQTGPAIRKDQDTIQKHQNMLEDEHIRELYELITQDIQRFK